MNVLYNRQTVRKGPEFGVKRCIMHYNSDPHMRGQSKRIIKVIAMVFVCVAFVVLTIKLFPVIMMLKEESVREDVRDYVNNSGVFGVLLMLGTQLLQVILSIISGEPVEVLFGFIYGPWYGALFCLSGITLGSFAVFCVTRALGKNFMSKAENSEKFKKLKFLKDPKKRDMIIATL